MLLSSLRPWTFVPRLTRSVVNKAAQKPVPTPRGSLLGTNATASGFLTTIGREAETKVTIKSWEDLWKLNGHALKRTGLAVKDRRYVLWCLEKYRQGADPSEFAHPPKPKKKIRGWGPAVQNGKRLRSRR